MLISIVMDPACLAPDILSEGDARFGAETILQGVIENGVLLAPETGQYVKMLATAASRLGSHTGQLVQLLIAEIAKNCSMFVTGSERTQISSTAPRIETSDLGRLAIELRADVVVCRDDREVRYLCNLRDTGIEVCTLSEYRYSKTEAKRKKWTQTTRIDNLREEQIVELVGRIVRYSRDIFVVDKYFASKAKDGFINKGLRPFVEGLLYVAKSWSKSSPFASVSFPTVHLLSVAGGTGASGGYVEPSMAEKTIRKLVQRLDSNRAIGELRISLKLDKIPPIARDRFLSAMGRCFGVQHGIDDIGKLDLPKKRRGPTSLIPDCQDYRDLFTEIKALPSAR